MKNIPLYVVIILVLAISILAFWGGVIFQSSCPVEIDNKIRYSELLNWITTIGIGFYVSFVLRNQYENSKTIKGYLLSDLKSISKDVLDIKEHFIDLNSSSTFNEEKRAEIVSQMNGIDKSINVFCVFMNECFSNRSANDTKNLVNAYNMLNKVLTGSGMYTNPLNQSYFDEVTAESAKFESQLRQLTLKIIKRY